MSSLPPNSAALPAMIPDDRKENMAMLLRQELPVAETEAKCGTAVLAVCSGMSRYQNQR